MAKCATCAINSLLKGVRFPFDRQLKRFPLRSLAVYCQSMSRKRQNLERLTGPDGSVLVRTYPVTFPNGYCSGSHSHEWDQLTYAASGVMTVHTEKGTWVVPPHRAVWVPAGTQHTEEMSGKVAARSLYFVRGLSRSLPRQCSTVNVT